jgi:hypothetical protein
MILRLIRGSLDTFLSAEQGRGNEGARYGIGTIDYCAVDGAGANGIMLYIKPSRRGIKNIATQAYATTHPEFPHQHTMNQWFTESQFESYRELGFETTERILSSVACEESVGEHATLEEVLIALQNRVLPSEGGLGRFENHLPK